MLRKFSYILGFFLFISSAFAHQSNIDDQLLPLGDGYVSSSPKAGYIYSCKTSFNGGGSHRVGDWIFGDKWKPSAKPIVQGEVMWSNHSFSISDEGEKRIVRSNDLPSHATGIFPIRYMDPAYAFDTNPNSILEQNIVLTLSKNPQIASRASCLPMGMIGIALTGVAIFNGLDDMGRDAPAHEVQDLCNGHPEMRGTYHYHNLSPCMNDNSGQKGKHSDIVGYALDGFGIYGEFGENGQRLYSKDLDACHGHDHQIVWNGIPQKIYHYHLTRDYPYTLGCFKGVVSNQKQGMQQRPQRGYDGPFSETNQQRQSHEQALANVARKFNVDANQLRRYIGPPPPNFSYAAQMLNVSEEELRSAFEEEMGFSGPR